MVAQLGNIQFKGLTSFDTFVAKRKSDYAQHELIDGKPALQRMGTALEGITFTISLHTAFVTPEDAIATFDTSRENGDIMTLFMGTGDIISDFVITEVERGITQLDAGGKIVSAELTLTLLECVDATNTRLAQKKQYVQDNAFASADNAPGVTNTTPPTPQSLLDKITSACNAAQTWINKINAQVTLAEMQVANYVGLMAQIKDVAFTTTNSITTAINTLTSAPAIIAQAVGLPALLNAQLTAAQNMYNQVNGNTPISLLESLLEALVLATEAVTVGLAPLIILLGLRFVF